MPELPEIRAHAERLDALVSGSRIEGFDPISFTVLKTATPDPASTHGRELVAVRQRGKHLVLEVDGPDGARTSFVVHLMQGGRLVPDESKSARPKGGLARWRLDSGPNLLLREAGTEKRAGVWMVEGDPLVQDPLADLGPDADTVTEEQLASLLAGTSGRLHGFLRDQRNIAGIGRRLANEVCHRARTSPFANTSRMTAEEVAALHVAIHECIAESLEFERGRPEMSSSKDRPSAVHSRIGEPCPRCGDVVREVVYNRYTVAYCATCQTGGKVLADNTTSKFLK